MVQELKEKFYESIGRRKTSSARVRVYEGAKHGFTVNDKDVKEYFVTTELQHIVHAPFAELAITKPPMVTVKVVGGGIHSQAEAVKMGIARALIAMDSTMRKQVKVLGLLSRDPRAKERRKFGLKKARKAPQWSKR